MTVTENSFRFNVYVLIVINNNDNKRNTSTTRVCTVVLVLRLLCFPCPNNTYYYGNFRLSNYFQCTHYVYYYRYYRRLYSFFSSTSPLPPPPIRTVLHHGFIGFYSKPYLPSGVIPEFCTVVVVVTGFGIHFYNIRIFFFMKFHYSFGRLACSQLTDHYYLILQGTGLCCYIILQIANL